MRSQFYNYVMYEGVSKSFETSSIDRQPMAVHEWVRCAWEQGTLPLSMPNGVAVWTLGVAQHECLSPRVPLHLGFQHGCGTGADSKHQILPETRQIWSGDFSNETACVWKWGHELKMKLQLKGRRFDRVEEIQLESQNVLGTLWEQDFQHTFQQWQRCWDRCVAAQGDYFEGDAAQT